MHTGASNFIHRHVIYCLARGTTIASQRHHTTFVRRIVGQYIDDRMAYMLNQEPVETKGDKRHLKKSGRKSEYKKIPDRKQIYDREKIRQKTQKQHLIEIQFLTCAAAKMNHVFGRVHMHVSNLLRAGQPQLMRSDARASR